MTNRAPISIVVLYHNGPHYLKACLNSLISSVQMTDEILVVVNNTEQSLHDTLYYSDRVRYIHIYENLGHGKAGNTGVHYAAHQHIVISDHDLVFQPGWIDELWQLYIGNKQIGAACCKIINTQNQRVLDIGIAFSGFNFSHPFMDLPPDHPLTCLDRQTQMICTGGFLISKDHFNLVGGFDETYGTLYTDLDISLRLKQAGLKVGVASKAVAYHFSGELFHKPRAYKAGFLKSDIKGAFMMRHSNTLEVDLPIYYQQSANYFNETRGRFAKYFMCNLMNVVNPTWYEDLFLSFSASYYDRVHRPSGHRDAEFVLLFDALGYDLMALGVPIAYLVDRFVSVRHNSFWWKNRRCIKKDIIIDRNANIIAVNDLLST